MGRLGDWDKVERKRRPVKFTRTDEIMEYLKIVVMIGLALAYAYFLFY